VASWSEGRLALDLRTGFEHESNGQGGDDSRSLNIAYVMPTLRLGTAGAWRFSVAPKIYDYVGDLSDNPDIADYRGYVDLQLAARQHDGVHVVALLRKGTRSDYGSVELDVTLPVRRLGLRGVGAFLHLQYFAGWGETLRTYDQKLPSEIRVGFAIVR
jgi:outer membrane phospholipase A